MFKETIVWDLKLNVCDLVLQNVLSSEPEGENNEMK